MFIVLYRWRVKPHLEAQFIENWSERTAFWLDKYDSLGSRLHRGNDGIWYSYAQWKSAEQRIKAFEAESVNTSESAQRMTEAIEESLPEVQLEMISDFIIFSEKM